MNYSIKYWKRAFIAPLIGTLSIEKIEVAYHRKKWLTSVSEIIRLLFDLNQYQLKQVWYSRQHTKDIAQRKEDSKIVEKLFY